MERNFPSQSRSACAALEENPCNETGSSAGAAESARVESNKSKVNCQRCIEWPPREIEPEYNAFRRAGLWESGNNRSRNAFRP